MSIFLGGTGSANELHDYEEGNWTPTIYQGGWTISNTNAAKYTKIGKVVTIWQYMTVTGTGNGDDLILAGLPFGIEDNVYATGAADMGKGGVKGVYARVEGHTTDRVGFYYSSENTSLSRIALDANQIGANYIIFSVSYATTA